MTIQPEQIARLENGELVLLDQRLLPAERVEQRYARWQDIADAIRTMVVRGAPAIGVAAAYGVAVAARSGRAELDAACPGLVAARPTAVNLPWAVGRMREVADAAPDGELIATLDAAAAALHAEEVARCHLIGDHGAALIPDGARRAHPLQRGGARHRRLRHGAGRDPLGAQPRPVDLVWVDETRPLLQGARLTAWELVEDGIPATLVTDSMAGWLMAQGRVQARGHRRRPGRAKRRRGEQDRHLCAERARRRTTACRSTSPRRARPSTPRWRPGPRSRSSTATRSEVRSAARPRSGIDVYNPAFDVTPAENITAIVTEHGVHRPPYDLG